MTPFIHTKMELEIFVNRYGASYIQSRSNPKTSALSALSEKKKRDEAQLFLAEGVKLTEEALRYAEVQSIAVSASAAEQNPKAAEAAEEAGRRGIPVIVFADSAFEKITTEKAPQGVIAAVKYRNELHIREHFDIWQQGKRLLMLDEIRDPGNLGTILRSAEAMGVNGVILSGCADIYSQKTVRAAMGTLFRMPLYLTDHGAECARQMRTLGRRVLAAALGAHTLTLGAYETLDSDCPVIGNEGHGVSDALLREADDCVRIPMSGQTESLNAAAAAAVILWEYHRSRT